MQPVTFAEAIGRPLTEEEAQNLRNQQQLPEKMQEEDWFAHFDDVIKTPDDRKQLLEDYSRKCVARDFMRFIDGNGFDGHKMMWSKKGIFVGNT